MSKTQFLLHREHQCYFTKDHMPFMEIFVVYSEDNIKSVRIHCGADLNIPDLKSTCGACGWHCDSEGLDITRTETTHTLTHAHTHTL